MNWLFPFSKSWLQKQIDCHGTPIFLVDLDSIEERFLRFRHYLPEVEIFYAMKSLDADPVLKRLAQLGSGFDVASSLEIQKALQYVPSSKVFYTHPYKTEKSLAFSYENGLRHVVFDNESELIKFQQYADFYRPFLRISVFNESSVVKMHTKFGADFETARALLRKAEELGIVIHGLTFHVGSQSLKNQAYHLALHQCRALIEEEKRYGFHNIKTINLGGGYPISYQNFSLSLEDERAYFDSIREGLKPFLKEGIRLISEPGRFISGPSGFSISRVISHGIRAQKPVYYLDDGLYGLYSGLIYDHAKYTIFPFKRDLSSFEGKGKESSLFGVSCDSIDVIESSLKLPELNIGDILIGIHMGAYTHVSAGNFNGLEKATCVYWMK